MSETIELARQYYYSTPEQMKTFLNKFHKGSGLLYLTEKSITLENAPFVLDIPLATINSIKIEYFSRWIKPIPTASLLIWDINKHLKNWVATFEQIDALKEKIKRPLPPLATSPTSEHILILILAIIGAGLLIAGAASLLRLLF